MKVKNKTTGKTIAFESIPAVSIARKALGLMFMKSLPRDSCMIMKFKKPGFHMIWMPFMRFPIDIIFLDESKKVINAVENAIPMTLNPLTWRLYGPGSPASFIIEAEKGSVKRTKTGKGDEISF